MLALAATLAHAVPVIADPVTDEAGVLGPADEAALDRQIRDLRDRTGVTVAVLTVQSLPWDQPIEAFALAVAERWAGGRLGRDDGLLVVLAIADRRSRIEVGYGLEGYVTDLESGRLLAAAAPHLQAERYGAALAGIVDGLGAEVHGLTPEAAIPPQRHLLGAGLRLARGPEPLGLAALAGGALAAMAGWGWWGVGPPVGLALRLHRGWRRFVALSLAAVLAAIGAVALLVGTQAALGALGVALAGATVFGPLGAAPSRAQLWAGAVAALVLTVAAWSLSLGGGEWTVAFWSLYPIASVVVAFFALEGGWRGSGGSGSGTGSEPSSSAGSGGGASAGAASEPSGGSGGDWSGGGGRFGGGGASGSW